MKIRSVLLGSAAVLGLSTAGYAADLGVVTSLDVCDELGLSGLTISSDDNCLVITGGVSFEYDWGDYSDGGANPGVTIFTNFARSGNVVTVINPDGTPDSNADVDAWLKFVATADSDFGPASATIKLVSNNITGTTTGTVGVTEAWVSIGDTTMLMAGYKGSIFNKGDDVPLNYLGLFNSSDVNTGVGFYSAANTGGDVIQIVSNLGNGVSIGGGVEALGTSTMPTFVGVLSYAGDGITGHVSGAYDSNLAVWNVHAGFTGSWDPIKVVAAVAADSSGWWNALGSVAATFDMFTLAASGEATSAGEWGVGASVGATVSDGVSFNLGGRYFDATAASGDTIAQVEAAVSAAVTETITITAAVGAYNTTGSNPAPTYGTVYYGKAGLAWAPGGGFTSSVSGEVNSTGAYKAVFKAAKDR